MANPSIVNATAVGKEVIRRQYISESGESEATILTGVANHIMTIVSIIVTDRSGQADNNFHLYVDYDLSGTNIYFLLNQPVGADATFVWSDKFAITATDKLHILGFSTTGTATYDVWCTYIDQQFAAP